MATASTHMHTQNMSTVTIEIAGDVAEDKLDSWLEGLLWEKTLMSRDTGQPMIVLRMKGMLSLLGNPNRIIVQAVNEIVEKLPTKIEWASNDRFTRMIFIGQLCCC